MCHVCRPQTGERAVDNNVFGAETVENVVVGEEEVEELDASNVSNGRTDKTPRRCFMLKDTGRRDPGQK